MNNNAGEFWEVVTARGHLFILRCGMAAQAAGTLRQAMDRREVWAHWIDTPAEACEFLPRWCGVGNAPDEQVAKLLLDKAQSILQINPMAGSVVECRWQAESAAGDSTRPEATAVARVLLSAHGATAVEAVREGLASLPAMGWTAQGPPVMAPAALRRLRTL